MMGPAEEEKAKALGLVDDYGQVMVESRKSGMRTIRNFKLRVELADSLDAYALTKGRKRNDVIWSILTDFLAREEEGQAPPAPVPEAGGHLVISVRLQGARLEPKELEEVRDLIQKAIKERVKVEVSASKT